MLCLVLIDVFHTQATVCLYKCWASLTLVKDADCSSKQNIIHKIHLEKVQESLGSYFHFLRIPGCCLSIWKKKTSYTSVKFSENAGAATTFVSAISMLRCQNDKTRRYSGTTRRDTRMCQEFRING